ncbi:10383_t:CDS:2, partial [Funneliformis geosporum]
MKKPTKDHNLLELTYQYRLESNQKVKNILTKTADELYKQQKELVEIKKQKPYLYQIQSQVLHDIPYRLVPLNNKYNANFTCQLPKPKQLTIQEIQRQLGIDIGVINLFATSEGFIYKNPHFFTKIEEKLIKLYRSLSRKQHKRNEEDLTEKSKNFEKARLKLMKAFRKVVCRINDLNHKLSKKIVDKFDLIAYEDWKLSKAFEKKDKQRKFSKYTVKGLSELRIADFFAKLDYKAKLKGKITYPVRPEYTSKTCFNCKEINPNLEKQRWFICANPLCNYEADRDINASKNILYKTQT